MYSVGDKVRVINYTLGIEDMKRYLGCVTNIRTVIDNEVYMLECSDDYYWYVDWLEPVQTFNEGDKVRIVKCGVEEGSKKYLGIITTVKTRYEDDSYRLCCDSESYIWPGEWLEYVDVDYKSVTSDEFAKILQET